MNANFISISLLICFLGVSPLLYAQEAAPNEKSEKVLTSMAKEKGIAPSIQEPQFKMKKEKVKMTKTIKTKPVANIQRKEAQLQKSREKLKAAKAKLEKERLEGTLPGDYIASKEAKFLKQEKRLETLLKLIESSKSMK